MVSTRVYEITENDRKRYPESSSAQQAGKGGIIQERHTTDILFLIAIIGLWALMTVVGAMACEKGNLDRLVHPIDDTGSICAGATPKFYTVSPNTGMGSCVASCPKNNSVVTSTNSKDYICLTWVKDLGLSSSGMETYIKTSCMSNGQFNPSGLGSCGCNLIYATTSVFDRCIFDDSSVRKNYKSQSARDYFLTFIGDVLEARNVIFAFGFLASLAAAFIYTHLLRFRTLGLIMVWTCIISLVGMCGLFVWLNVHTALAWADENPPAHSDHARIALLVFCAVLAAGSFLFLCVCISLRKQIDIAVRVMALTAMAVEAMPLIVLSPLVQCAGLALFSVPFMFYAFNVASAGTFEKQYASCTSSVPGLCTAANAAMSASGRSNSTEIFVGVQYQLNSDAAAEQLWYLFFCLLWTMNFIAGIGTLVIAVAIARWYFTAPDDRHQVNSLSVFKAYGIVLRYHMGTAAFGGLIIAIVQLARWIALYIEKHFKQTGSGTRTIIIRVVFCCVDCCLACLECCMKFISKNAYIQTAIHGGGFCSGCKEAFFVIARNILSIGAVSVVSGLGLLVGKIWICGVVGMAAFYWFTVSYQSNLRDLVAPTVLVMIIAYITASVFLDVFHTAVDTVIMCFIHDMESNQGRPIYADQSMSDFINEHGPIKDEKGAEGNDGNRQQVL